MTDPRSLRILGIDPGLCNVGVAVVDVSGNWPDVAYSLVDARVFSTKPEHGKRGGTMCTDDARRVGYLYSSLRGVISAYKPDLIGLEETSGSRSARSGAAMARGHTLALCAVLSATTKRAIEVSVAAAKEAATGAQGAGKDLVRDLVIARVNGVAFTDALRGVANTKREHAFDATAIAMAVARRDIARVLLAERAR